jgi:hypothetical protein
MEGIRNLDRMTRHCAAIDGTNKESDFMGRRRGHFQS